MNRLTDAWPVLCLNCALGLHQRDRFGVGGCDWPGGCECCHPLCIARPHRGAPLMTVGQGIDFAWHPALNYADLRRQGYTFVCRYLSHDDGKNLHADEARGWLAAGLAIVLVWESTATRAEAGRPAGVQDATDALAQSRACGAPDSTIIYFAVDEDTSVGPNISGYFQGVQSVLGARRVGVYGSFQVVRTCLDQGLATYAWQTYAWSGGQWDPRARLRQVRNGVTVSGISSDIDTAAGDIGAWQPALPCPPAGHDRWLKLTNPPMRDLPGHHDVSDVQHALVLASLLTADQVDGVYGPVTAAAVNKLDQQHSWPAGCGPDMWALLRSIAHPAASHG